MLTRLDSGLRANRVGRDMGEETQGQAMPISRLPRQRVFVFDLRTPACPPGERVSDTCDLTPASPHWPSSMPCKPASDSLKSFTYTSVPYPKLSRKVDLHVTGAAGRSGGVNVENEKIATQKSVVS